MNATLTANLPATEVPRFDRARAIFYAMSFPVILLFSFLVFETYPEAAMVNGHDPLEMTPAEMGYTGHSAKWLADHNIKNVTPYPGYKSGELL